MTKRIVVGVVLAVIIFLVGFGAMKALSSRTKEKKTVQQVSNKRFVQTATVDYQNISSSITASGRVYSQQITDVITEVRGKILEGSIPLKTGASFRKNDVLFRVYQKDALFTHKANVSKFLNSLAAVLPDLKIDFPERYAEWEEFFNAINLDNDLPEIPVTQSTKEKIFITSRGIMSSYYSLLAAEEQLKKYTIYAPFDGSFQKVNYEKGSVANPGSPIARIINTNNLEIEVPVPAVDIQWLKTGHKVQVMDENNLLITQGVITRISDFINESTQTFNIYVKAKAKGSELYSGQYLKVKIDGIMVPNGIEVPRNALFNHNKIFVVDSSMLKIHEINILKYSQKNVIINGLNEGEIIVTEPLANVKENTSVEY